MRYTEYKPSKDLEAYVKCYYSLECPENTLVEDKAFATGCLELMFVLDGARWQTNTNGVFEETSAVELWGQLLQPIEFKITGRSVAIGIRFLTSAVALLLQDDVSHFNNGVFDMASIVGNSLNGLHARLQEAKSINSRIELIEAFLRKRLVEQPKAIAKISLVQQIVGELTRKDFFDNIDNVASRYGITSRYLQKIFLRHTGLTPKLLMKVNRFQNSLVMMNEGNRSLTSVAYECGYFDQSHFIKEFKSFTGCIPSGFDLTNTTAILASPNK